MKLRELTERLGSIALENATGDEDITHVATMCHLSRIQVMRNF
jgi:hypothetical protein